MSIKFQLWANSQRKNSERLEDMFARLANDIGCSLNGIRKWYYGQRTPSKTYMRRLYAYSGGEITADSFEDYSNIHPARAARTDLDTALN